MNNTTHFNLKKPEYTDFADIQDINDNMDTIDGQLAAPTGDVRDATVSFSDSDLDSNINSFSDFLNKIVSGMKLAKFIRDFKAGMAYVLHKGSLINNGTTSVTGTYALDAAYGKTLKDYYDSLNSSLANKADSTLASTSANGLLRKLSGNTSQYLRGDGTWQDLKNNLLTQDAGYALDARAGYNVYQNSLYSKGSVVSFSTNLNNITTPGVYQVPGSANATNLPTGATYGTLVVIRGALASSFLNQVFYVPSDGTVAVYTRSSVDSGSTWRAWALFTDAAALNNYLLKTDVVNSQTVTASGYALDAKQANPNVSGSLGAKIATNTTNVGTLMDNLVDLKFEHVVKTGVGTGYVAANQLFFKSKNLNVTNYNGHGFFIILNQAPAPGDSTECGTSLYVVTFSSGNDNGYNIQRIISTGYTGSGSNYYPKINPLASGNIYACWNALPSGQGNSANIHASIFQLY